MIKIKIMQIPNVEKLKKIIEQSCGDVLLHLPDNNTVHDLKNDSIALQFLKQKASKGSGVEIYLSEAKDYFKFVYYTMFDCL
ncbi:hypothetical protein [Peribacillus sp. Bi96]|uniref:hypothetical protein n=1 Tax=Peribacillus sp. Bi96 TaxID=2884273 RepID=UPI001E3E9E3C|nr:hypothetical protein [Peribacillus sp. Bi96]